MIGRLQILMSGFNSARGNSIGGTFRKCPVIITIIKEPFLNCERQNKSAAIIILCAWPAGRLSVCASHLHSCSLKTIKMHSGVTHTQPGSIRGSLNRDKGAWPASPIRKGKNSIPHAWIAPLLRAQLHIKILIIIYICSPYI